MSYLIQKFNNLTEENEGEPFCVEEHELDAWRSNQFKIDCMPEDEARRLNLRQTNAKPKSWIREGWEPTFIRRTASGYSCCFHCGSTNFGIDGPCKDCGNPPFLRRKS